MYPSIMYIVNFLGEAFVVGFIIVIIGSFIQKIPKITMVKIDDAIIKLFLIGVTTHVLCELFGINKWYCTNGAACSKN